MARASIELAGWLFLRAATQAITIFCLAKFLGLKDYGAFITIMAIAGIAASVAGLGLPSVVLRDGSRRPAELPFLVGSALSVCWRSVLLFAAGTSAVVSVVLPPVEASWVSIYAMIFIEILSISLIELLGRAFQAQQNTRAYGAMHAGLSIARLAALAFAWAVGLDDLTTWLCSYISANIAYIAAVTWLTWRRIGWRSGTNRLCPMIVEGAPFTTAGVSVRLQAEFNKPLLAQAAFADAGNFNIAQRAVDLISLPILAVQEALWPRLYADTDHRQRLLIAGMTLVLMSFMGAIVIIVAAQTVPWVLGEDFRSAAELMTWLAFLPLLVVLRSIGTVQLIATGRTRLLTWVYIIGGTSGLAFSTLLISRYGLLGAVWASYTTEATSVITALIFFKIRPEV
ncbi:MAG: oligosaccharide flippase family protein [Cellvibrionaceae bacterium]|nr:oligosaccharide flippase family protein [Cellvibrionaceae bacterium]